MTDSSYRNSRHKPKVPQMLMFHFWCMSTFTLAACARNAQHILVLRWWRALISLFGHNIVILGLRFCASKPTYLSILIWNNPHSNSLAEDSQPTAKRFSRILFTWEPLENSIPADARFCQGWGLKAEQTFRRHICCWKPLFVCTQPHLKARHLPAEHRKTHVSKRDVEQTHTHTGGKNQDWRFAPIQ